MPPTTPYRLDTTMSDTRMPRHSLATLFNPLSVQRGSDNYTYQQWAHIRGAIRRGAGDAGDRDVNRHAYVVTEWDGEFYDDEPIGSVYFLSCAGWMRTVDTDDVRYSLVLVDGI